MPSELPPIVKHAERLLVEIEQAVSRFQSRHKRLVGEDLRRQAMTVARFIHRAWRDQARRAEWIDRLVWAVDDLKLTMQLGCGVRAFASFAQFEMLSRLARELGREVGGWKKNHPQGQSAARVAARQRPKTLSTHAASMCEAKP